MAHNGGRSSLCPGALPSGTQFPLLDYIRTAQAWQAGAGDAIPAILSDAGYPQSTPTSPFLTAFFIPDTVTEYTGHWVLKWTGKGQFKVASSGGYTVISGASFVSGSTAVALTTTFASNGTIEFTFNAQNSQVVFYCLDADATLSDIKFYRKDQESRVNAGEVFNPEWLAKLTAENFGLYRWMDLQLTNNNNNTQWAHRTRTTDWSYASEKWLTACWVGSTAGTGVAYTCSKPSGMGAAWADGDVVQAQIHTASTSTTPTIQPTGLVAKTITDSFGRALGVGDMAINANCTLVYNATLDCVLYHATGLSVAMPIEHLVTLCNTQNAHAWFNVPFLALDNYITQLATLVLNSLRSDLRRYYELSNEIWNSIFAQSYLAGFIGIAAGISQSSNRHIFYAHSKRFRQMAALLTAVDAAARPMLGVQAAGDVSVTDTYLFKSTDESVVSPNRAIDKAHGFCLATYFMGQKALQFDTDYSGALTTLLGWADDWATGTAAQKAAALAAMDVDIRSSGGPYTLNAFTGTTWPAWHAKAVTYNKKMLEYEGALAINAPSAARLTALGLDPAYHAKIDNLFRDGYKSNVLAKTITTDRYNAWVAQAQAEFPSQFALVANNDPWAVIQTDLFGTIYQPYYAIAAFNASSGLVDTHDGEKIWHQKTYFEPAVLRSALDILPAEAIAELESISEPQRTDSVYVPLEHRINVDELMERVELAYQVREAVKAADEEDIEMLLLGTP